MSTLKLPLNGPKELQTRFLYPFFFKRRQVKAVSEALAGVTFPGRDGKPLRGWECAQLPHEFYKEEVLDQVVGFLFQGSRAAGCEYVKLSNRVANRWFNSTEFLLPDATKLPVCLAGHGGIELFLSCYGVGVLSIGLSPGQEALPMNQAAEFNYRLSQLRERTAAELHIPHPAEGRSKWDQLPPELREQLEQQKSPDRKAPIDQRLGKVGGTFTLRELIDYLLLPLKDFEDLERPQNQFSVYTVARFEGAVDFEKPEVCTSLATFLSALAQIEEPTHAGTPVGTVGVTEAILNRRHWAGVGLLGAAHLIADQPPADHPFNAARMPRVFSKYFIPYLLALLQRLTLQRTIQEAGIIVRSGGEDTDKKLADLRAHLLAFAADGYFTRVSSREVLHRYYRMAQEGLDVPNALDEVRQAISDIEAKYAAQYRDKLAENIDSNLAATKMLQGEMAQNVEATKRLQHSMNEHLEIVARVQKRVEQIEVFVVSVYFAHLFHMIFSEVEALEGWMWLVVIAGAVIGALIGLRILRPWEHRSSKTKPRGT